MKINIAFLISFGIVAHLAFGDVYLHNPRGSNNRLNEASTGRANANRLFDSQNNNNGGYNVGDKHASASSSEATQYNMAYFQSGKNYKTLKGHTGKSLLTIEWTNQHGCGHKDLNCNFVLQYRCQEDEKHKTLNHHSMRNGRTTSISKHTQQKYSSRSAKNSRLNSDSLSFTRGLHEPWEWYDKCSKRSSLASKPKKCVRASNGRCCVLPFIHSNRRTYYSCAQAGGWCSTTYRYVGQWGYCKDKITIYAKPSKHTRQNPNGNRYGYECPEERDYYPYWHPTDWIDIAVMTDEPSFCSYYQKESFNVKPKGECLEKYSGNGGFKHTSVYNKKADCEKNKGIWVEFSNYLEFYPQAHTESACNDSSTKARRLIWAIPYRSEDIDNLKMKNKDVNSLKRCLVALDAPDCRKTSYSRPNHLGNVRGVVPQRYQWVLPHFPSRKAQRCVLRIRYNISSGDTPPFDPLSKNDKNITKSKFKLTNNPTVKVGYVQLSLKLAINPAQFGRTFQDRSHLFKLLPRPKTVTNDDVIYNLNVRGKRGNIVQVYPAVEYDFIPKRLHMAAGSLCHIQWTGSNTNPSGNAGQGSARLDRNNMVEMKGPSVNYPLQSGETLSLFTKAEIVWKSDIATVTKEDLILSMASSGYYNSATFCQPSPKKTALDTLLDRAPASYRGFLLRFAPGTYYYMCTRNNNFTNRNQKGRIHVHTNSNTTTTEQADELEEEFLNKFA